MKHTATELSKYIYIYFFFCCNLFVFWMSLFPPHGVPIFGKIEQILIVGETVILRYKRLRVLEYGSHLNAYKVVELNEVACIKQKELQGNW